MTDQKNNYELDKFIWTQDDFEQMCWHDSRIYGFVFENNNENWASDLLFDIDYIFKWVNPVPPAKSYTFWVSPCTLIFKECFDLSISVQTNGNSLDLLEITDICLISKIEQEKNKFLFDWSVDLQEGKITFKSYGFKQVVRELPIHTNQQILTFEERNNANFSRKPYSENKNVR